MSKYEVKSVVCDYGVFENGELRLILNNRANARLVKAILEKDEKESGRAFRPEDFSEFMTQPHDIHPDMCNLTAVIGEPDKNEEKCQGYGSLSNGGATAEICKVCRRYVGYGKNEDQPEQDAPWGIVNLDNARQIKNCLNSYRDIRCGVCGAEYEDDDKAYLQETGMCQYCHSRVYLLFVRYHVSSEAFMDKCRKLIRAINESKRQRRDSSRVMKLYQERIESMKGGKDNE